MPAASGIVLVLVAGTCLLFIGAALTIHAVQRLRNPGWRESPLWRRHPLAAAMLSGTLIPMFGMDERTNESFAAALEGGVGAFAVIAGALFFISYL